MPNKDGTLKQKEINELMDKMDAYESCREIIEIYAGMEGSGIAETAPEAYLERIIKQMYDCAVRGIGDTEEKVFSKEEFEDIIKRPIKEEILPKEEIDALIQAISSPKERILQCKMFLGDTLEDFEKSINDWLLAYGKKVYDVTQSNDGFVIIWYWD